MQDLQKQLNLMEKRHNDTIDAMKADYDESLDTIWMLLAGLLVFFMHAGFSLLESGSVRFKNAQNILSKNLLVLTLGFLCFYVFGWPVAYGVLADPNKFMGFTQFAADGFWDDKTLFRNWFFQGAFCATACTIVSGAMAERTQLKGLGIFGIVTTSFIYPVVCYWGWSGSGLLNYTDDDGNGVSAFGPGYIDFAGSGIVHLVGGVGALVGSICVGSRQGRFDGTSSDDDDFVGHNVPFVVIGTFCLWFGWYGFNPGSTLSMKTASDAATAGLVAVNTTLAPCVAGLVVFLLRALVLPPKKLDVGAFCNGILAGLVSITAGCAIVKPWETIIIGFIGGLVYQGASMTLRALKIDDVVDAFPVHGACGIWGVLACGLFGNPDEEIGGNGLFYGGDQFRVQVMGIICIVAWVGVMSLLIMAPLRKLGLLRLSDTYQKEGADMIEHSPRRASRYEDSGAKNSATKDVSEPEEEKVPEKVSEEEKAQNEEMMV